MCQNLLMMLLCNMSNGLRSDLLSHVGDKKIKDVKELLTILHNRDKRNQFGKTKGRNATIELSP